MSTLHALLDDLEHTLGGLPPRARPILARLRQEAAAQHLRMASVERGRQGLLLLLGRSERVRASSDANTLATEMLDALIGVSGVERGVTAAIEPGGGWTFLAARSMSGESLEAPDAEVSRSVIRRSLDTLRPVLLGDALRDEAGASIAALKLRSVACLPLVRDGRAIGFVYLDHRTSPDHFTDETLAAIEACLPMFAAAFDRTLGADEAGLRGVVTRSEKLKAQLRALARVARFDAPVLLTGETGTGKGLIARQLHRTSPRGRSPFVHVNCAALPESLVESELFGAEAGAYTGARGARAGRFEVAAGGTLFLDELDSMPLACQAKLLIAIQEKVVTRLGASRPIAVDCRIIAAMGRAPRQAIAEGLLREDLYYRLCVVEARIPPLRERPEDLDLLADHALATARERHGLPPIRLSETARAQLRAHTWPGNVRELENVIERAALLAEGERIDRIPLESSGEAPRAAPPGGSSQPASERRMVIRPEEFWAAWHACAGNAVEVSERLGVAVRSVYRMRRRLEAADDG